MTTITCYGAVGCIGGNKILVEDGDTRLFLDFGLDFGHAGKFFNEYLRPRPARGLLDLLALGLLPPLEGLYRDDLALPGLWERFRPHPLYRDVRREGLAADAVLFSHGHLDHNADISYVNPRIPVYCTRVTAFIARAMQITGQSNFERELVYINPRAPSESGELLSDRKSPYRCRPHYFVDGGLTDVAKDYWEHLPKSEGGRGKAFEPACAHPAPESVNGLPIRWWPVDHSIPGAGGYAIRTSAGWIAYTGDIRFHGKAGELSRQFARDLARLHPVALLCEGTRPDPDPSPTTEADIIANALRLVRDAASRLVVADFGPRNVERLESFARVARETGRTLLILPKDAYLLQAMALANPEQYTPPEQQPVLQLYADPKAAPRPWEQNLRDAWPRPLVSPEDVSRSPGEYILCFSLWDANDLLDLQGVEGGIYLYSSSRAYDDEQAADLDRLRNWVRHMGFTLHGDPDDKGRVPLHASGHASGPELVEFVATVKPDILIPIHTERPEWWERELAGTGIRIHRPEMGRPIPLA
ncbi:MAG: ribonuclease J [Anaerolineales bacterium]